MNDLYSLNKVTETPLCLEEQLESQTSLAAVGTYT